MLGNLLKDQDKVMVPRDGPLRTTQIQVLELEEDTKSQLEVINQATFSTEKHQKLPPENKLSLITLPINNFWTTLEKDLPREVPEVLLPLEESSRLLMITDLKPLTSKSSQNACMISELV